MNKEIQFKGKKGTSRTTLWLKKSELEAINELVGRLDADKNVKELEDWVALKTILTQHKELARAKTYFFTGTIIKKVKEKFRETNEKLGAKAGDEYFKLELDLKLPNDNRNLIIYCAWFNLDDPADYEKDVVPCMTGETYEFEVELWVENRYRLRKILRKIN